MLYTRLQSFTPISSKDLLVTESSPGEVSRTNYAADSCTAAHLERFFRWEPGTLPIWEGDTPPEKATMLVVECRYNPRFDSYSYRFWREESINNNK